MEQVLVLWKMKGVLLLDWISIEDRLPKVNGVYIVYAQDENSQASEGIWEQELTRILDVNKDNNFKITEKLFKWRG